MKNYVFVLLLISISALAAEKKPIDYEKMKDKCIKDSLNAPNHAGPSATLSGCAENTSFEAKKEINSLYKRLYEKISKESPENASKLELSQKSWLTYRSKYCELVGSYVGSPMYYDCPMNLNILRVNELRELVSQFE